MASRKPQYDVIIAGAGPAGLSVASELAAHLKVLVFDRKPKLGDSTKSWLLPTLVYTGSHELQPYMYRGVKRFLNATFSGANTRWDARLDGGYLYAREHELLEYWGKRTQDYGSDVRLGCTYKDHDARATAVDVLTDQGTFRAKLLIDATGSDSPILKELEIPQPNYYWWSVYGAIVEHPNGLPANMRVGDYMLWQTFRDTNIREETSLRDGRPVFEYEILTEHTTFPLVLYLQKNKVDTETMKTEFMHILYEEESTRNLRDVTIREEKWGWYPSNKIDTPLAKNRVTLIGDAGCWTAPCGWGMTFILKNYKSYARDLLALIRANTLDEHTLRHHLPLQAYDAHQMLLNQIATHFLANAPVEEIDRFIRFFSENPERQAMCEKVFTLSLTVDEMQKTLKDFLNAFDLVKLAKLIPREDYLLLLEEANAFTESWIKDKIGDAQRIVETMVEKITT